MLKSMILSMILSYRLIFVCEHYINSAKPRHRTPETQKGGRISPAARWGLSPQQLTLLLFPDQRETAPQGLHGEIRFAEDELVDDCRREQRQPGRLRHHAGINADGLRQRLDVGVSPVVDQRLPVKSPGKIQQQGRITSR